MNCTDEVGRTIQTSEIVKVDNGISSQEISEAGSMVLQNQFADRAPKQGTRGINGAGRSIQIERVGDLSLAKRQLRGCGIVLIRK